MAWAVIELRRGIEAATSIWGYQTAASEEAGAREARCAAAGIIVTCRAARVRIVEGPAVRLVSFLEALGVTFATSPTEPLAWSIPSGDMLRERLEATIVQDRTEIGTELTSRIQDLDEPADAGEA
jgi:hypothetical protein